MFYRLKFSPKSKSPLVWALIINSYSFLYGADQVGTNTHMAESFQDYSWIQDFEADFLWVKD